MTGPPITLMKSRRLIELSREPQDHAKRTLVYTTLTVVWGLKSRDENTVASRQRQAIRKDLLTFC